MPEYLQSPKLSKILTELCYLQFLRSLFQHHLTIIAAYILNYIETRAKRCRDFRAWKAGQIQTRTPLSVSYKAVLDHEITRPPKFALSIALRKYNWLELHNSLLFTHTSFLYIILFRCNASDATHRMQCIGCNASDATHQTRHTGCKAPPCFFDLDF